LSAADMACCPLPCCSEKRMTCWQIFVFTNGVLFVIAAIWAMNVVTGDVTSNLRCITNSINELKSNLANTQFPAGREAADRIPQDTVDSIDRALDSVDLIAVAPGALAMVFVFLTVASSCVAYRKAAMCFPVSKCFLCVTLVVFIINIIFFAILMIAGIAAQQEQAREQWASVTSTCTTSAASLQTQIDDAQAQLNTAQAAAAAAGQSAATAASVATAQSDLNAASAQMTIFSTMCGCIGNTLSTLEPLAGPGVFGLLASILGLITIDSLCCAMGCCCKRPGKIGSVSAEA